MEHVSMLGLLALSATAVGAALWYLRATTRRVLLDLCDSSHGADFWLRALDVLALAGSLGLVLVAVPWNAAPAAQLRWTLALTLLGLFVSVALVASTVWRSVAPSVVGREDAREAV